MIKAIIFDCFGVIVSDALSVMTSELNVTNPGAVDRIRTLLSRANTGQITADESYREIAGIFGLTYAVYRARIAENEVRDQKLLAYILELRNKYKTALLSNIPQGSLRRRFTSKELRQYFDKVVASGEIGYAKPHVRAYQIVAEQLGVEPEECVFTDDRRPYCDGAKLMGMQTILFQDFKQFRMDLEILLANAQ